MGALSSQHGGCLAEPGWESQDLRSKRRLKQRNRTSGVEPRGAAASSPGGGMAGRPLRPPLPSEPETTSPLGSAGSRGRTHHSCRLARRAELPRRSNLCPEQQVPHAAPRVGGWERQRCRGTDLQHPPPQSCCLRPGRRFCPSEETSGGRAGGRQLEVLAGETADENTAWGLRRLKGDRASRGKPEAQAVTVHRARSHEAGRGASSAGCWGRW